MVVGSGAHVHNLVVNARDCSTITVRADGMPDVRKRECPAAFAPSTFTAPVGRDRELSLIGSLLREHIPVQLHGPSGIGKSTMLRHIAQEDGGQVIYLCAAGQTLDDLLQIIFDVCYETDGYRPNAAQLQEFLDDVEALLVVDDFAGSRDELTELITTVPSCRVLVASSRQTLWSGGAAVRLSGLDEKSGTRLLGRLLGHRLGVDEENAAADLVREHAGNPMTLTQIAVASRRTGSWIGPCREDPAALLAEKVSAAGSRVLGVLSACSGEFIPISTLMALSRLDSSAELGALERLGLVVQADGYRMASGFAERVARLVATETAPAALAAALTTWIATVPDRTVVTEAAPVIVRVLRNAVATGSYVEATVLARAAAPALARALRLGAWGEVLELGRRAARASGDFRAEAYFSHEAGVRLVALGRTLAAGPSFVAAIELSRCSGDARAAVVSQAQADAAEVPMVFPTHRSPCVFRWVQQRFAAIPAVVAAVMAVVATVVLLSGPVEQDASGGIPLPAGPSVSTTVPGARMDSPSATGPTSPKGSSSQGSETATVRTVPTKAAMPVGGTTCAPGAAMNFGVVEVGYQQAVSQQFFADPCHPRGFESGGMTVRGRSGDVFQLSVGRCPDIVRPAGQGEPCTVTVTFRPREAGVFEAELVVPAVNAPDRPGVVRLTGAARSAPVPGEPTSATVRSAEPTTTPPPVALPCPTERGDCRAGPGTGQRRHDPDPQSVKRNLSPVENRPTLWRAVFPHP
ncbi:ATP-binding protein [Longimycelium tulufanense]|uniref:ATP-binding protein n=1 Tax=Longimycelium tulufanense TaxID=907463 RepID=UPI00166A6C70|nr:ATP-binding protein [Longimycelium tulufanense]